jgi:hypothetical protein
VLYNSFGIAALKAMSVSNEKKHGLKCVYCTVDENDVEICKSIYPEAVIHSLQDARCAIPPLAYSPPNRFVFDLPAMKRLVEYESIFCYMADRMDSDGWKFSSTQRRRFFYSIIKYWCDVLVDLDIDFVMSRNVPHFPSEFGLYIACQLINRKFLMGDFMAILERSWIIYSIEDRSLIIREKVQAGNVDILENIWSLLKKQKSDYNHAVPDYFINLRNQNLRSEKSKTLTFFRIFKEFIRVIPRYKKKSKMTMAINYKPIKSGKSMPNRIQGFKVKLDARLRINKNKRFYDKLSKAPLGGNIPIVYFAPNYQPERTTLPDAGLFADVLRILDLISSVLPKDWIIYYKEHPSIFNLPERGLFWRGHMYRNIEFYESVSEYSNVQIIPVEIDSFDIIDKAKCTVTATGTVALESVARGVPSLVFGSVWFDSIEGVVKVNTKQDVEGLFNKIKNGYKPDKDRIARYLQVAWNCSSPEYPDLLLRNIDEKESIIYRTKIESMVNDYLNCLEHAKNKRKYSQKPILNSNIIQVNQL